MLNTHNWHIELSSMCYLKCPRCPRTVKKNEYVPTEIGLQDFQRIFNPDYLKSNVQKIIFCGSLGDPIYCRDFLPIYDYIKLASPETVITTITNGSYRKLEWWSEFKTLVDWGDEIIFSIDGYDSRSNQQYRENSHWESIMEAVEVMKGGAAILSWSTILFRFNEDKIEDIVALAQSSGFDRFSLNFSSIFGSNYSYLVDKDLGYDPLEPRGENVSTSFRYGKENQWLDEVSDTRKTKYKEARQRIRSTNQELENKVRQEFENSPIIPLCLQGDRALYLSADLQLFPCCWTSAGSSEVDFTMLFDQSSKGTGPESALSLKEKSFEDVLEHPSWMGLWESWKDGVSTPVECLKKCGNKSKSTGEDVAIERS